MIRPNFILIGRILSSSFLDIFISFCSVKCETEDFFYLVFKGAIKDEINVNLETPSIQPFCGIIIFVI